ncbi:MAG: hypothetical protein LWW94_08780 [Candidatus Desulfofervidaceae bacterium]|nr:hypothetical protein [Candidatus Desulfofervidaceae bacterium]
MFSKRLKEIEPDNIFLSGNKRPLPDNKGFAEVLVVETKIGYEVFLNKYPKATIIKGAGWSTRQFGRSDRKIAAENKQKGRRCLKIIGIVDNGYAGSLDSPIQL